MHLFLGLTSVAMAHSLLSSAITNTDWYMESLEEHIVDILHSGFSLRTQITRCVSTERKQAAFGVRVRRAHVQQGGREDDSTGV